MRKSIIIDGITLSFIELNEKEDKTIFFLHGNSSSAESWQFQMQSDLLNQYRLIAIDLPAHGLSSPLPDNNYSILTLSNTLVNALKKLTKGKPYIVVSFSLATNIAVEMLKDGIIPEGLILIGPCLLGGPYTLDKMAKPRNKPAPVFMDNTEKHLINEFYDDIFFVKEERIIRKAIDDYHNVRFPFRSTLIESAINGHFSDEIKLLQNYPREVLIIFGNEDSLINNDYLDTAPFKLWKKQIFKIPQADHFVHIDQPETLNSLLSEYLTDQLK